MNSVTTGPNTFVVNDYIDVGARLQDLRAWKQAYLIEDEQLAQEIAGLDMNNSVDRQKGIQIGIRRRRMRLMQVHAPIEFSSEAIQRIGYAALRQDLVRQFAELSDSDRLLWLNNFLLIITPDLREVSDKIADVRGYLSLGQQRNFLLGGPSGMGKTTFLDWYVYRHMASVANGNNHIPVVKVDAPVGNSPRPLLRRIVLEFGVNYLRSDNEEDLLMKIAFYTQACDLEMMVIDEIEHLKKPELRRRVLEISNLTRGVPIVVASCHPLRFRDSDVEIQGRWKDYKHLRPFKGAALQQLLAFIELLLPFPEPSFLAQYELHLSPNKKVMGPAQFIEAKTEGILREIMVLIHDASVRAIERHQSRLTMELLAEVWNDIQHQDPDASQNK